FSEPPNNGSHYDSSLGTTSHHVTHGQWIVFASPLILHPKTPNHDLSHHTRTHNVIHHIKVDHVDANYES
ncbi:hypothetical protein HAX54_025820, partial [Datura stramonium]|nr:hypothetical protein [Datura stramonium]